MSANEARTAALARLPTPMSSRPSSRAATPYSSFNVVANIGGSSLLIVTQTPASTMAMIGCLVRSVTAPVARLEVGQTSTGISCLVRCASSWGSWTADVP